MLLSVCGLTCNECEFYNTSCTGCQNVKGSTFWALEMMPEKICPLYDCAVNRKAFNNCGDCPDLPCSMFLEMKDPSLSDEEHQVSVRKRVSALKGN